MHVSTSLKTPGLTSVLTSSHARPPQQVRAPEQSPFSATHAVGGGGEATTPGGGGRGGLGGGLGGPGGLGERMCTTTGGEGGGDGRGGGDGLRKWPGPEKSKPVASSRRLSSRGMSSHASQKSRPITSSSRSRRHPRLGQQHVDFFAAARSSASRSASRSSSSGTSTTTGTSWAPVGTLRPLLGFHDSKVKATMARKHVRTFSVLIARTNR